jgi:hypothetical protein
VAALKREARTRVLLAHLRYPGHQQEARAGKAGGGFGTLAAIGYGAIWLPWAAAYGKQRRERLAREKRKAEDDED